MDTRGKAKEEARIPRAPSSGRMGPLPTRRRKLRRLVILSPSYPNIFVGSALARSILASAIARIALGTTTRSLLTRPSHALLRFRHNRHNGRLIPRKGRRARVKVRGTTRVPTDRPRVPEALGPNSLAAPSRMAARVTPKEEREAGSSVSTFSVVSARTATLASSRTSRTISKRL